MAIVVAALYFAQDVLIPLALATLLAFLLAPLVSQLERWNWPRVPAVIGIVLLLFGVIAVLGWLVAGQLANVTENLPEYRANLTEKVTALREQFGGTVGRATQTVKEFGEDLANVTPGEEEVDPVKVEVDGPQVGPIEGIQSTLGPLFSILGTAGIVVVFVVFMLLQREDLRDRFIRLVGGGEIPVTTQAIDEASQRVSRYLLTQTLINGVHGVVVAIGLAFIGFDNFLLWGLLSMLLRFVPYVGPWIAAGFPIFLSLVAFPGWSTPLVTIGFYVVLELASNNWLEPWLYGTRTGVSPLAILVSAVFWTWLWGAVGLVLATPLTVCLTVIGKYVTPLQFLTILLGDEPVLGPSTRLYQRLLAADEGEAWRVLSKARETQSLIVVYDTLAIPALRDSEQDQRAGRLEPGVQEVVIEHLGRMIDRLGERERAERGGSVLERRCRVLCLPARDAADALAATMLAHVLDDAEIEACAISGHALASELLDDIDERGTDLICISAVPPTALAHARYLYKRIVARFPEIPVVIGVWDGALDRQETSERIGCQSNAQVVTTLHEARAKVREAGLPMKCREVAAAGDRGGEVPR